MAGVDETADRTPVPPSSERVGPDVRGRGERRWIWQGLVYLAPLVAIGYAAWAMRWIADDGFIYLRVVHQLNAGHGPVFNIGERVETYTSPMWLAMLSVGDLLTPLRLEWVTVGLGIACTVCGFGLAMAGAARLVRSRVGRDAFLVPFGVLVLAALLPVWSFATSGLETSLAFLWLGGCLLVLAQWADSGTPMRTVAAIFVGLGWLIRPELVLDSLAFVALVIVSQWHTDRGRDRVRLLAIAFGLPLAYQVFRMGYFGELVAATAIAKEAARARPARGWHYLLDFTRPYWLVIPLAAVAVGGYVPTFFALRRDGRERAIGVLATFAVAGLLNGAYIVAIGGDYFHARLLLPGLFALCVPVAVIPLTRQYLAAGVIVPWGLAGAMVFRPPEYRHQFANGYVVERAGGAVTIQDYGWGQGGPNRQWYRGPGFYYVVNSFYGFYQPFDPALAERLPEPGAMVQAIGITGYAMGNHFYVLDLFGLADPVDAHLRVSLSDAGLALPGHEKPMPPPWATAELFPVGVYADSNNFVRLGSALLPATSGEAFRAQTAWARAALQCPSIKHLLDSSDTPLTPGRFLTNIIHAPSNTRLRIPPDPEEAYRRFCGPGVPAEVRALQDASSATLSSH